MTGLGYAQFTEEQVERTEAIRGRLDSAYGTDNAHWQAAASMVGSGVLDDLLADAHRQGRADALAAFVEPSEVTISALSAVLARDVWDSHAGRRVDFTSLSPATQQRQCSVARRHLDALRRFLIGPA